MKTTYLLTWLAMKPEVSIPFFAKGGFVTPAGVTLISNWHVVANPRGFALLEVTDPAVFHALIIEWEKVINLQVDQVISDADALRVLGKPTVVKSKV
jgi:Na+/H+ antiporter NhaA